MSDLSDQEDIDMLTAEVWQGEPLMFEMELDNDTPLTCPMDVDHGKEFLN